ncbi:MAG: 50S ribosomal protein L35 [Halanaerobiaceae bacterium]
MPKMKTHKGIKKRVKKTGKGKLKRKKAFNSHLQTKKKAKRKRNLSKAVIVDDAHSKKYKHLLPYE